MTFVPLRGQATSWIAEVKADASERSLQDIFRNAGAFMDPTTRTPTDNKATVTYNVKGAGNLNKRTFPTEVVALYPDSTPTAF